MKAIVQQEEYQDILRMLVDYLDNDNRRLVLFLGPDVSAWAGLSTTREPIPDGRQLARKLAEDLFSDDWKECVQNPSEDASGGMFPGGFVSQAAEAYEAKHGRPALLKFLKDELTDSKPRWLHELVWYLPLAAIYTTNYDLLVEDAEPKLKQPLAGFKNDEEQKIWPIFDEPDCFDFRGGGNVVPYYKLLGCLKAGNAVVTSKDYIKLVSRIHTLCIFENLKNRLAAPGQSCLFIGYGLTDTALLATIYAAYPDGSDKFPLSFATVNSPNPAVAKYWYEHFGIRTIDREPNLFLADLLRLRGNPSSWEQFIRVLTATYFAGLALYGGSNKDTLFNRMLDECRQRQVLAISIDMPPVAPLEEHNRERIADLLKAIAHQMDHQLSQADVPNPRLQNEVGLCVNRSRGKIESQFKDPGSGQFRWATDMKYLCRYESELAEQVSLEFRRQLRSELRERRLIIFIRNFEQVEHDDSLARAITEHWFGGLAREDNIGLVFIRQTDRPFSPELLGRCFLGKSLDNLREFNMDKNE